MDYTFIRNAYRVMLEDRKVLSFCESSFVTRTFANVDHGALFATTTIKVLLSLGQSMKITSESDENILVKPS